ncbi:hypothetical protein P4E94_14880 [Pontiellaceae bacterium B12219]|nr:hypothetical protein [Pontiellaceae bacterium B12219]
MRNTVYLLPLAVLLASCGNEGVETYRVPKEKAETPAIQMAQQAAAPAMQAAAPVSSAGFTADLPEGWKEVPSSSAMRKASYSIEGTDIDFYLISLSMGDVPSNVNRWRGQVGLPNATPEEIEADIEAFEADGHEIKYIEIYNEEGGKGIIAAIVDLAPTYWYFTGKGSVEELRANAEGMQAFLKSIQFEGHNH